MDYSAYNVAEPLVAGVATANGQRVRVLDGAALIDALARALASPLYSTAAATGRA